MANKVEILVNISRKFILVSLLNFFNSKNKRFINLLVFTLIVSVSFFIYTISVSNYSYGQITKNKSCGCVVFRLDDVQDDFLDSGQLAVMNVFLSKNQSLSVGLVMNQFGNDTSIVDKVREGYSKHLFEIALHGWDHVNYANLTENEQMMTLHRANQKLHDIFGIRSKIFIPPYNTYSNGTIDSMYRLGLQIISSQEELLIPSDKFSLDPEGTNDSFNSYKIYNIPETSDFTDFRGDWWIKSPLSQVMHNIDRSIQKYGYSVVTLHPQGFVYSTKGNFTYIVNNTEIHDLNALINSILSKGLRISSFLNVTGLDSEVKDTTKPFLKDPRLKAEVVFDGLDFPTKMSFLGNNDILVLEKNNGLVKRIVNGSLMQTVLDANVSTKGERGMLGIAVGLRDKLPPYVFLYYTEASTADGDDVSANLGPLGDRLYRYEFVDNKLNNPKLLLNIPSSSQWANNGGQIRIGPDNNLYLTIGDLEEKGKSQNILNGSSPDGAGGILRISQNGKYVSGIIGNTPPLNLYFAYGIRNSFGMDFDPISGKLWDTENGSFLLDEINLVGPGFNSGWEKQGTQYQKGVNTGFLVTNRGDLIYFNDKGNYRQPEMTFYFRTGLTGLAFFKSDKLGLKYTNDIFVGDFHNGYLYDFNLSTDRAHIFLPTKDNAVHNIDELGNAQLGEGFGGIVDIEEGPDGYLYVLALHKGGDDCLVMAKQCIPYLSSMKGTIFRIVPTKYIESRID